MLNVTQYSLWSGWPFTTWVMSLLVDIMLYWFTYLGYKVWPSFHLGVLHQLRPVSLQLALSVEITLCKYILSTKNTIYFCKLILIYSLTPSFVWSCGFFKRIIVRCLLLCHNGEGTGHPKFVQETHTSFQLNPISFS